MENNTPPTSPTIPNSLSSSNVNPPSGVQTVPSIANVTPAPPAPQPPVNAAPAAPVVSTPVVDTPSSNLNEPTDNPATPPSSSVPPNKPKSRIKSILLAVIGLLLVAGVAFAGYYAGQEGMLSQWLGGTMEKDEAMEKVSPTPTEEMVACTLDAKICPDGTSVGRVGPNCEFAECPETDNQSSVDLKKNSVVLTGNINEGPRDYIYSFEYPNSWELKITEHTNDDLLQNCQDYEIFSSNTVVNIKTVCNTWEGKPISNPEDYVIVEDLGLRGVDSSHHYVIRYLDTKTKIHNYALVRLGQEEDLATGEALNEILVTYPPDDHFFVPTIVTVASNSEAELGLADQIVKSLTLTRQ